MKIFNFRRPIPPAWAKFLRLFFCFSVIRGFSSTFISTYLIRATGSELGVMEFNIVLAAVQPFAMVLSVIIMHRKGALFTQSIGMVLYAAAFLVLTVMGESAAGYIQWISAIFSAANGFFFTTYALQLLSYTEDDNRDACYGVQSALGGTIGIILPFLTGILLASFKNFTGYRVQFILGFLISAAAVYINLRLEPLRNMSPELHLKRTLHILVHRKPARAAMFASTASGFYDGTMSFFLNMLIYSIVFNEAVIGVLTTAGSILSIISSMVYARILRPENRMKVILISLGIAIGAACLLLVSTALPMLILFSLLLSAVSGFFINPPVVAYFGMVERMPELKGLGNEVHSLREFWYSIGRILGVLLTMRFIGLQNGVGIVILIILVIQIIPALLMKVMQAAE